MTPLVPCTLPPPPLSPPPLPCCRRRRLPFDVAPAASLTSPQLAPPHPPLPSPSSRPPPSSAPPRVGSSPLLTVPPPIPYARRQPGFSDRRCVTRPATGAADPAMAASGPPDPATAGLGLDRSVDGQGHIQKPSTSMSEGFRCSATGTTGLLLMDDGLSPVEKIMF